MNAELTDDSRAIQISAETTDIRVAPGSSIEVSVKIYNNSASAGNYQIFIDGIPQDWVSTSAPINYLEADEEKEILLNIQPPAQPETGPGEIPFSVRVINDQDARQEDKVDLILTMSAYTSEGRIGVMLNATSYSTTPGSSTTLQMLLLNQGLVDDVFKISVEGIPISWISTSTPVVQLAVGEQQRVNLTIIPPPGTSLHAGLHPFQLQVTSEHAADQYVKIDCELSLMPVGGFGVEISPPEIGTGQSATVLIQNNGNYDETYTVIFKSEDDALEFDLTDVNSELSVSAGNRGSLEFTPKPKQRPLFGSGAIYPIFAHVVSGGNEEKTAESKLSVDPMIPFWIIPAVLALCLVVICVSFAIFIYQDQSGNTDATQTASLQLTETAGGGIIIPTSTTDPAFTPVPTENPEPTVIPTEPPTPTLVPPSPTLSPEPTISPTDTQIVIPDVGRIAFQSNRDGDPELYLQDTGTGAIGRLTQSLGVDTQPSYSPDGSRLAFMSDRTGNNEIFIANADGSNPVNITNHPEVDQMPSWSPDGEWIAFTTNRDGNLEIYRMRPDGTDLENLTSSPTDDQASSWFNSPSGQFIVFQSNRDGNQEIYIMNPDGSNQANVSNNSSDDMTPAGATNGSSIAFTSNRDGNLEIYLMSLDGSNQINLTSNPSADQSPAWSPDSNWLAFITDRDGNQEIYIIRNNGSEIYNITNNPAIDIVPDFQ